LARRCEAQIWGDGEYPQLGRPGGPCLQEAKSLELRAATCLARLWQSQGKRLAAYDLLASVYGWYTEGFDTADLREAKGLLP